MAAVTVSTNVEKTGRDGKKLIRYYGTSASNSADTLTTPAVGENKKQKLYSVTAQYSGSPTQAGVVTSIDSVFGSGYDTTINTGSANVAFTSFLPSMGYWLGAGDALVVSVPAGGSGQTVGIIVTVEEE